MVCDLWWGEHVAGVREWSVIAVQTAWKLDPVHYYEENPAPDNTQAAGSDQVVYNPV